MKKWGFSLVIIICICCSSQNRTDHDGTPALLTDILEYMNDKTFEECKKAISAYRSDIVRMLEVAESNQKKLEEYVKDPDALFPFMVNKTADFTPVDLKKAIENKLYFSQKEDDDSLMKLSLIIRRGMLPDWYEMRYKVTKIYFSDGSVSEPDEVLLEGDFYDMKFDRAGKRVDSVEMKMKVMYPVDVKKLNLSEQNPSIKLDSGEVKIIELKSNYVFVSMPNSYDFIDLLAIDKDNNLLEERGAPYTARLQVLEDIAYYKKLLKDLTALEEKIKAGKYKTKESLIADYTEIIPKYRDTFKDDNYYVGSAYYGKIDTAILCISEESKLDSIQFTVYDEVTKYIDR